MSKLTSSKYISEKELHAMRMGPGKHLKGRTLFNGIVKPEEVRISTCWNYLSDLNISTSQFDYFHELIITQELCRIGARGYGDGELMISLYLLSLIVISRVARRKGYWSPTRSKFWL